MEQLDFSFLSRGELRDPIFLKFREFHRQNPAVYEELKVLSFELLHKGHRRYGIKGLFEVLRWKNALKTKSKDFKLNNNYTAYYARVIMMNEPGLKGFFELRVSRADVLAAGREKKEDKDG